MGQEIADSYFSKEDFAAFHQQLTRETRLLEQWFLDRRFPESDCVGGFELESWLIDGAARPAPVNEVLLEHLDDPLVVPELSRFNVELNGNPKQLRGDALSAFARELTATWRRCDDCARELNTRLAMIGILPTVREDDLNPGNMSALRRFHALDEQLRRIRGGVPLQMDIIGRERLRFSHDDVMLEAATTSFQIHLKVSADRAAKLYNVSKMLAAPMVALSANSPFLFGHDLWDETRIPLFEQAVQVGGREQSNRVTLGTRYVKRSIMECFQANLDAYPVLLPRVMDQPVEELAHLRLHNGTIWRWNRPLIGINESGVPHLRIEHRVVPAGPTIEDSIANAAFYFGVACALVEEMEQPESRLPFESARRNFYLAAESGLDSVIEWFDGRRGPVADLCSGSLLPMARRGLDRLGIEPQESEHWLGIISRRIQSRQNGSVWQRRWVARHGRDMAGLTEAYLERQNEGAPVHQWVL